MHNKHKLLLVAGARPNFMKIAPVIREIQKRSNALEFVLVHTGQHYDEGMSDVFFRELEIPAPNYHLDVGSGTHARQTAAIMVAFEPILESEKPDCVLVFGDVNSTLACSIVAKKLGFPVAHVEAGLRSGDMAMPEEINRIVTDSISDVFFVTEESGLSNLLAEGKPAAAIHHVGHVMVDNLLYEVARLDAKPGDCPESDALKRGKERYGVVTLHRPSNVDDIDTLGGIVTALNTIAESLPLIFPVHPRTRGRLEQFGLRLSDNVTLTKPLGYQDFLNLWRDARLILTDSGGVQEESTALGVPCLTLRTNTERPITVTQGTNQLVGTDKTRIIECALAQLGGDGQRQTRSRPALWDGQASARIIDVLQAMAKRAD